jgi:hypothetical protein
MSQASVMIGLLNRIICKRVIIYIHLLARVWRIVVVQCGEVLVFPGGVSGVAGSRNRWSCLARVTNHTLRFTFQIFFSAFGGATGASATATAFPFPLALVATARAGFLSSLYPCRSPLFLRLCPRCCPICLPSFLLFGLHHCNAISNSGF